MADPSFRIEPASVPEPGVAAIVLAGRITFDEAAAARREILERLARTEPDRVVLELGDLAQLDTAGAAVLAEALKFGESQGKRVLLCRPSRSVLRIFRLAGFAEVLDCCCSDPAEVSRRFREAG